MSKCSVVMPTRAESDYCTRLSFREIEPLYIGGIEILLTANGLVPESFHGTTAVSADIELSGASLHDKIELFKRHYACGNGDYITYWVTDSDFNKCFN